MVEIIQSTAAQKIQWERAARLLEASGVSWLLVYKPEDILLLSGIWPQSSMNLLLISPEERRAYLIAAENALEGRLVPDELDVIGYNYVSLWKTDADTTIRETLQRIVGKAKGLGFPLSDPYASVSPLLAEIFDMNANLQQLLRSGWPSLNLVDISTSLARVRAVKNEAEIAAIQRTAEIAEVGVSALDALETNFSSISEAELALQIQHKIEAEAVARGLRARAWAQISSGPRTGTAAYLDFVEPTQRLIKEGDLVLLELVTIVEGFWADLTYPVQAGGWSQPSTRRMYESVRSAQAKAVEALVPGATGAEIDAAARAVLRERGFEREFFHSTGHSVGFRYHENYPLLRPESNDQIAIGQVVTVEPGVYGPGFGLRLEADIAVTKEGPEWLSRRPVALT
jgi:Xaa-Pro aminopeptidase